ncbi:hypothetical protein L1987_71933 [Smallanthus sonchifolius]|uniref:Uncharacterized protein n=1 Tax=Smallanthus sonchifolius TaxID=185202 RepID=A0ACB9AUH3_9ASTR|nr:hypothetical protein L1987_71933 [Smallanthus sonchifolius]
MSGELRTKILDAAHKSRYSIHPGTNKMYQDLRKEYWWPGMKHEVTKYVSKCLTCSQVKTEHQKPYGKIQPLDIPEWKWEHITMDFITKLPRTAKGHDPIWVIVDRLMKSDHFLPIHETFSSERLAEVFINEVVARYGMPLTIVSDRDTRFTSRFWKRFHEAMGTRLNISTAYHPQMDGQSERTIQTLEDMLRACIIDFGGSWDSHLPLAEFSYNNSHHTTIGMTPYEMLYWRRCRTLVCWGEIGQKELGSLEVVRETSERFDQIKARMKAAQDRQKSYADKRLRPIEFDVGDKVLRTYQVRKKKVMRTYQVRKKKVMRNYQVRKKKIGSGVVGPLFRITQISLSGNEGYGYGKYVMGLYLLRAFVAGQLLYKWGDDGHQGDYRDP